MSDAELLEALGLAFSGGGWRAVGLADGGPVRLRVDHPSMPGVGPVTDVTGVADRICSASRLARALKGGSR